MEEGEIKAGPVEDSFSPSLSLPKSGLTLEGSNLVKRVKSQVVARHPLSTIKSLELRHRFDPASLILGLGALTIAVVCWRLIPSDLWSWLLGLLFLFAGIIGLVSTIAQKLSIITEHGEVSYSTMDATDEIKGFVLSLKEEHAAFRSGVALSPNFSLQRTPPSG